MSTSTLFDDTIVAIASAPGPAQRGIVRLSGSDALKCVSAFCRFGTADQTSQQPAELRVAQMLPGLLTLPDFFEPVAADVYIWPTARSYTRMPTVELHTHGSPPLLEAIVETALHAGARPARPGEFTLRAFLAGRLDLTQAEAVLGVIDAHSDRQLRTALSQLAGGLAGPLQTLRESLLTALAHLEAGLDFVEEDIEFISRAELSAHLAAGHEQIAALLARLQHRSTGIERFRVVLCGEPNVGKSSLFNALAGGQRAIVAPVAGTTRDYLVAQLELDGLRIELVDTAGIDPTAESGQAGFDSLQSIDEASQSIEQSARLATLAQTAAADLQCLCFDASRPLTEQQRSLIAVELPNTLVVWTKADSIAPQDRPQTGIVTSSTTGQGLDTLRCELRTRAEAAVAFDSEVVPATAVRTRASLEAAGAALDRAVGLVQSQGGEELVAIELRAALDALGEVVGAVYTDDILDRIFSRFCIGK